MTARPIYLDHNASTTPHPEVVEAMLPWLGHAHANPHAEHMHGRFAAEAVEETKASIAELIGANADEILLTSGATESINLVLQGYLRDQGHDAALIHTAIEHKAVFETANALRERGISVRVIPVDCKGRVDPTHVRGAVDAAAVSRVLVSVIHANNEIGTVAPLGAISDALRGARALLHIDASQSNGKIPLSVTEGPLDFVSLSSHKIGGPTGIGALYVAAELRQFLRPLFYGGGQQEGLRPGTIPVFLAVGYGVACKLAIQRMAEDAIYVEKLAEAFLQKLYARRIAFQVLGDESARLPGLRSICIAGIDARDLLDRISKDVSASTGSACAAGAIRSSHVLSALGLTARHAEQVMRFGFARSTNFVEAERAAVVLADACLSSVTADKSTPA